MNEDNKKKLADIFGDLPTCEIQANTFQTLLEKANSYESSPKDRYFLHEMGSVLYFTPNSEYGTWLNKAGGVELSSYFTLDRISTSICREITEADAIAYLKQWKII